MLQFTLKPETPATAITIGSVKLAGPTMADLHAHVTGRTSLSGKTRKSYLGAIKRVGEEMNTPLAAIPACLEAFQARFPKKGFDPTAWPTHKAYDLFHRRVCASLREFHGVHAALADLRAREDDWTLLFATIAPLTKGRIGQAVCWHPMKLAALKSFALVARAYGWQPQDLTAEAGLRLDQDFHGNKRDSNRRCLANLDDLRRFPQVLSRLPSEAIGYTSDYRRAVKQGLPEAWEQQMMDWVDGVTKTGWDPVSKKFADNHQGSALVMRVAMRRFCHIALDIGLPIDPGDLRPLLADEAAVCKLASEMLSCKDRPPKAGRLTPRTIRRYLSSLARVRAHLGIDNDELGLIIANNEVAREGALADKCMTASNRRFCEALIDQFPLRSRFLRSFETLRRAAEAIQAAARAENRELSKREAAELRMLGAAACFCAIEIGGAPIRVKNAMCLTVTGLDAQMRIPKKKTAPIKVCIPAGLTKNGVEIRFPIRADRFGLNDTIRWYVDEIRPLFPHAAGSPFLFPAVRSAGRPMNPSWFGAQFADRMRMVVNLPMIPHKFRHGQTSLLLNAHPNEIEVIAKRIDDTADTLRRFYGFIDALRLTERGQDLVMEIMNDC